MLAPIAWSENRTLIDDAGIRETVPDTEHDLKVLGLGSWNDVLCCVAVACRVGTNQCCQILQRIEVLLVVLGGLAA